MLTMSLARNFKQIYCLDGKKVISCISKVKHMQVVPKTLQSFHIRRICSYCHGASAVDISRVGTSHYTSNSRCFSTFVKSLRLPSQSVSYCAKKQSIKSSSRNVFQSVKLSSSMADVPEGILMGIGNPLLDISICADEEFLKKYDLEANNAIIAGQKQMPMFEDMMTTYEPSYLAGGATQNSIRVAQWLLGKDKATVFFGCVGRDDKAQILESKAREDGVDVHYQVFEKLSTGVCGAIITGENRSLVAHLGAAEYFEHAWLENPKNWATVKRAQCYYIGGFVFPVCARAILDIAEHTAANNKTLVMNLSAPFLCKYFADTVHQDIMPYIDVLFGNEKEAETFCNLRGIEAKDIKEMALKTSQLPKQNPKRSRIVIFTQGVDPTIIAVDGNVSEHPITPVNKSDIKDTNGCGDSFVGGFLSQFVQGKPIEECLRCGRYAASVVVKHWGCCYPKQPDYK